MGCATKNDAPLSKELATICFQMADLVAAFHTAIWNSSYLSPAASIATERLNSSPYSREHIKQREEQQKAQE
jgi:hypothetical protein